MLSVDQLRAGMVLERDVYGPENNITPLIKKNTALTDRMIRTLREHNILEIGILEQQAALDPLYVPKKPPLIPPKVRDDALKNLEDIFVFTQQEDGALATQLVKELDAVVEQLVGSLLDDRSALVNIADLKSYDEYTYHHSLSVAVLSIAIGQAIGFSKRALNELGKTAMMHDIGKTAVPIEIINKPSRLSDQEFAIVKTHSSEGFQYLHHGRIGDPELWHSVLCHHEKFDGTGYPNGLAGEKIPLMSRIISVADVYDALTSNRPYRVPMQPWEAVEYVLGGSGTAFDYDIVSAFYRKLELYPVGSVVELSNGQLAIVVNSENTIRPVVRLLENGKDIDLYWDHRYLSITIKRVVEEDEVRTLVV